MKTSMKCTTRSLLLLLCISMILSLTIMYTSAALATGNQSEGTMIYRTIQEDTTMFANPEKGWYTQRYTNDVYSFTTLKNNFGTLVLLLSYLYDFRNGDISAAKLTEIRNAFNTCRNNNLSVMFRAGYTFVEKGQPERRTDFEPTDFKTILRHIEQLKPIFQDNADILYAVQAGFFGPWGEWHESIYSTAKWGDWIAVNFTSQVVNALMNAVPESAFILLRTPNYTRTLLGLQPSLNLSRLGQHDDGLFNGVNNCGTYMRTDNNGVNNSGSYASNDSDRAKELAWMNINCKTTPFMAESNGVTSYSDANNAVYELGLLHAQSLNVGYHPSVLDKWKASTYNGERTHDYITRKLGYNFVLRKVGISDTVSRGSNLYIQFDVENNGFGNLNKTKDFEVVLTKGTSTHIFKTSEDPRKWYKENGLMTKDIFVSIPNNIELGTWQVGFRVSSTYPSLKNKPEYSVRFANAGVWRSATGYNYIGDTIISETSTPAIQPTSVTISPKPVTLEIGKTQQLTATVLPTNAADKTATWSSSNTAVATVSATGLVTARSAGTTTITVITNTAGKTDACSVTVTAIIQPTSVTISPKPVTLEVGKTHQLTATILPTNAADKTVTWSSNNTAVATVSAAGLVTAISAGTATITVRTNTASRTDTCTVTANRYTLAYNANGGSGTVPASQQGGTVTVSPNGNLSRNGYNFVFWNTQPNGSGTTYQPGQTINLAANMTLYAQWMIYTLTYNANSGSGTKPVDQTGGRAALSGQYGLYRPGYFFTGWNTQSNGSGTTYQPGQTINHTGIITLYAQWAQIRTLTYSANNGSGTAPASQHGGSVTLNGQLGLYRQGYFFAGWNTQSNGGGTYYQPGQIINLTSNITLYAQWTRI